jgi:hypothetical protein
MLQLHIFPLLLLPNVVFFLDVLFPRALGEETLNILGCSGFTNSKTKLVRSIKYYFKEQLSSVVHYVLLKECRVSGVITSKCVPHAIPLKRL